MLQALVSKASRWFDAWNRALHREQMPPLDLLEPAAPGSRPAYEPLERVVLTDAVGRTLFEEYALHRESARGEEETGWVALGIRERSQALVLATLPAGAERSAGVAHVRFNSSAQALASRIVRQIDKRLTMFGVVHTHPGSLRHPSDGDWRGDSLWVGQLRGQEGIFGIGTADAKENELLVATQPKPHLQCLGPLCFSWYSLKHGERKYRPLPVSLTIGPDLAQPLRPIWTTIEQHAERLDRLARQQGGARFDVVEGKKDVALAVVVPLAEPGGAIRVLLEGSDCRYFVLRQGNVMAVDNPRAAHVDQGVYMLLAELAGQD